MASMTESNVDDLITRLRQVVETVPKGNTNLRQKLYYALQEASMDVEPPADTMVRLAHSPLEPCAALIAADLGVFKLLVESKTPLHLDELVKHTKADASLLKQVLQYLACVRMIKELDVDTFTASIVTPTLVRSEVIGAIKHGFKFTTPCLLKLPGILALTGYRKGADPGQLAFQFGHETNQELSTWLADHPMEFLENTKLYTQVMHTEIGTSICLDSPGVKEHVCKGDINPDTRLCVDIGSDWTQQPAKGAKAYYIRNVLREHSDSKCIDILQRIIPAMSKESVIVIDEAVAPPKGAHWYTVSFDMTLMASTAGMERTEEQWEHLLDAAGLKVERKIQNNLPLPNALIIAVPK